MMSDFISPPDEPMPDPPEVRALRDVASAIRDLTLVVENEGLLLRERLELEGKAAAGGPLALILGAVIGALVVSFFL